MRIESTRAIGAYAAVVTAIAAWALLNGTRAPLTQFHTIDVQRINVREGDGTLRMVIAGRDAIGGIVVEGKEVPHPGRTQAGMIFYNDEGTENGGLVFDGRLQGDKPTNSGSLTFDRWRQDQTVQMLSVEDGAERSAGFVVNDRPARPMDLSQIDRLRAMPAGAAKEAAYAAAGFGNAQRVYLGSRADGASELALRDAKGRPRLVLRVEGDGATSIRALDAKGKPVAVPFASPASAR